ncbi:MAG: nucleoside deaminase [Weeksellaceae bacterium]
MAEIFSDEYFMEKALHEAREALDKNEIPIGAVIVSKNKIIGKGHNLTETLNDVTAHAEMLAITSAAGYLGGKYLSECTLYITLEPCTMCAGALYWSQIGKIVVGAEDQKRGFRKIGNLLHPRTGITFGVKEEECSRLLKDFFKEKR